MSDEPTLPDECEPAAAPIAPERIGRYQILGELGEGGMGQVFVAEQREPVRRRVALKLIKWGMDTRQVIARFESERQALALMDHPSIAKVFDAGATEQGRPYFVMEYVDGAPIDEFCAEHGLSTPQRLELFLHVCAGLEHAHQKGIIHRDIKPSNILVHVEDGEPVPKIIDFGVAKATTRSLTDRTMYTEAGQLIGTPAYMSPEQAALGQMDVDTRTDVYSLGVLLYRVLAGALPFETDQVPIDEIRRSIREQEPQRPSTRVNGLGTLPSGTARVDRVALARRLRGDLDWICMKALEKDRARRYGSVSELAADIRRHLAHEPVSAGPPSATYRLAKFVRRHRTGVAAGTLVLVALIGGAAAATVGMVRARRAEDLARLEALRANEEAEAASQISNFLVGLFDTGDPNATHASDLTVRELVERGAARLHERLEDRPLLRARLLDSIGRLYQSLGLYDEARPLLEESRLLREKRLGPEHAEVAASLNSLGQLYYVTGDYERARELAERALGIQERNLGRDHPDVAASLHNLALLRWRSGDRDGARPLFERAAKIQEQALGPDDPYLAASLHGLADLLRAEGSYEEARPLYERVLGIYRVALHPQHPTVARALESLAKLMEETEELDSAVQLYGAALQIKSDTLGPTHPDLAPTLNSMADLLARSGDYDRARRLLRRSIEISQQSLGTNHEQVASTLWQLANVYRALGDRSSALPLFERALEIRGNLSAEDNPGLVYDRACYLAIAGEREQAIRELQRAVGLGFASDWLADDPDLDSLHGDPRFEALVAQVRRRGPDR